MKLSLAEIGLAFLMTPDSAAFQCRDEKQDEYDQAAEDQHQRRDECFSGGEKRFATRG